MTFKLAGLPCGCKGRVMGGGCLFYPSVGLENAVDAIVHLFNFHVMTEKDWTLDQLIDWVRSVEPAEPAPAAEPVVAEAEAVRT